MALSDVCTTLNNAKKNKGGAPRGNTNALKHGFYSPRFQNKDLQSLTAYEFRGLEDEIGLVRLAMKNVCDSFAGETTPEKSAHFLMLACTASATLNRLIRTQAALKLDDAIMQSALSEALSQVWDEIHDGTSPLVNPTPKVEWPPSVTPADDNGEDKTPLPSDAHNPCRSAAADLAAESANDHSPSREQTVHLSDSGFSCRGEAARSRAKPPIDFDGVPSFSSGLTDTLAWYASPSPENPTHPTNVSPKPEVVSGCFCKTPSPSTSSVHEPAPSRAQQPAPVSGASPELQTASLDAEDDIPPDLDPDGNPIDFEAGFYDRVLSPPWRKPPEIVADQPGRVKKSKPTKPEKPERSARWYSPQPSNGKELNRIDIPHNRIPTSRHRYKPRKDTYPPPFPCAAPPKQSGGGREAPRRSPAPRSIAGFRGKGNGV